MQHATLIRQLLGLALRRPSLWPAMVAAAWRFRARDWYRHPPFLPLPSESYLAWRLHTAYGEEGAEPDPRALERYLRWTSDMRRTRH